MRTDEGGLANRLQASLAQPKGRTLPFNPAIHSLMLGSDTAMAMGSPRYSAMAI